MELKTKTQFTRIMKKQYLFAVVSVIVFLALAAAHKPQPKEWPVPDKYLKMANPVKSDAEALSSGKELWVKNCQSCHGKSGKGDGPKASQLKTQPEDLGSAVIQKQPDGALFYKTSEGREDMPSFKKKITDQDDIWTIVNYIRTFKK